MGNFGKWLTALIIFIIVAAIFHFLTPWGAKAHSVKMGQSVDAALKSAGFPNVGVDMQGNVAKLTGEAASAQSRAAIVDTAAGAQCEKCADRANGERWHEVDDSELTVKQVLTVSPYTLTGTRLENGGILLDGYAQSELDRDRILATAETNFPGMVTDNKISIAEGAPHTGWADVAVANINGLGKLDIGRFNMNDSNSNLTGRTLSTDIRSAVNGLVQSAPNGYDMSASIDVPNTDAAFVGEIRDESICQTLFDDLKSDAKVNFSYNRAEIRDMESAALLGKLASAAKQCSSFRVTVEGHTDADGQDIYNLDLSQRRADTVVAFLVSAGVNPANVSGVGYGESRPIASNDTPAGMAANRRIEFKVTRAQ